MTFCSDDSECSTGGGICRFIFQGVLVEIFGLDSVVGQKTEDAAVSLVRLKSHLMCKYGVRTLHADNVFR